MTEAPRLVAVSSLDALYTAPPEEFVAARNALAKELKAAGDKGTAAEVTKLRRPPVSAWALNQVAREEPDEIATLLDAAAALAAALADPAGSDLRATQRSFRATIESVVKAAQQVVTGSGRTLSATFQQAVQATLQAAAVDPDIAATLRAGILAEDEPAPGFLIGAGTPAPRAPKAEEAVAVKAPTKRASLRSVPTPEPAAPKPTAAERAAERAAAKERARAGAREREAEREAERRRRARLAELRTEAQRLERRADRLDVAAEKAEQAAVDARSEAADARAEVDAILAALEAAEAEG